MRYSISTAFRNYGDVFKSGIFPSSPGVLPNGLGEQLPSLCREATEFGADGWFPEERPSLKKRANGTPPNLGGELACPAAFGQHPYSPAFFTDVLLHQHACNTPQSCTSNKTD